MVRTVAVYHKAKFWLGDPQHPRLSSDEFDVVHATPARKTKRGQVVDGHFDPAIVNNTNGEYAGVAGTISEQDAMSHDS